MNKARALTSYFPFLILAACSGGDDPSTSSTESSISSTSQSVSHSSSSSVTGQPPAPCISDPTNSGYCLVWQDEFSGSTVNLNNWSYERNCYGGGNNEAQCYVDDSQNVWVDGEYLHILARREDRQGPALLDDDPNYNPQDTSGFGTYSSGRLRTKNKADWKYGRFEIRAKLPAGQGTWPAIWMLPTEDAYGGWAASGEIDIMEAVNLKVGGERRIHGTLHFGGNWPDNVYSGEPYLLPNQANPADDFHTYAVEWEEGEIRWYVDGDHFATQTSEGWYSSNALNQAHAPFDQAFHLILNLAVGGDWAGQVNDTGIDESIFPQELIIDYVRVYQCTKDFETGRGCASSDGAFVQNPGITPPQPGVIIEGDELVIFDGELHPPFQWYFWSEAGSVALNTLTLSSDYGRVGQMNFNSNQAISYFQSESPLDIQAYQALEFDLRLIADPYPSSSQLTFRADCIYPCSSGDISIERPSINQWKHYRISLSELASSGLDLSAVNTPFVISPPWGEQQGVVVEVDNVRLLK